MSTTSDRATRHVELLTDTVAAVSSSLDLAEVLERIASRVADAMATDACFLYLYDDATGMLELRATHGTRSGSSRCPSRSARRSTWPRSRRWSRRRSASSCATA